MPCVVEIVLCNVVAHFLKIERCQGLYQQLF